jgi:acetyltransferase-like isoleucine patch superfamily enzyme
MKPPPTPPAKSCPDTQFLKAFSHAFGGGALIQASDAKGGDMLDFLLQHVLRRFSPVVGRMIWNRAASQCQLDPATRLGYGFQINNDGPAGNVSVGANAIVRGILHASRGGQIHIGDGVYIGDNTCIYSTNSIEIGAGTMIAHDVNVFDNDTHHKDWTLRKAEFDSLFKKKKGPIPPIASAPVVIGESCWIASGVFILKGCSIGARSIIGAGTVVTKDVPPDCVVHSRGGVSVRSLIPDRPTDFENSPS